MQNRSDFYLLRLSLRNFRNYKEQQVEFHPKLNVITGGNGHGKTNLLEALYVLATGRSFRTRYTEELIREGTSYFVLEASFYKNGLTQTLSLLYEKKNRKIQHNSTLLSHSGEILGLLPIALYAPEDAKLIHGAPVVRRRFLDIMTAQHDRSYLYHLVRYHQCMKQRNALLRSGAHKGFEPWEEQMAFSAAYLLQKRRDTIVSLAPLLQHHMQKLSEEKESLHAQLISSYSFEEMGNDIAAFYRKAYAATRDREFLYKQSLIGPHKDDLSLLHNLKEAKVYASEGQKRSCVLAMRLAEWDLLSQQCQVSPLLCMDDFDTHLDATRILALQNHMHASGQLFLTTPHPLKIDQKRDGFRFHIQEGVVTPVCDAVAMPT